MIDAHVLIHVCVTAEYRTGPAKPMVAPSNVGGGGGKVGDLTITWDLLPRDKHNGPELGYKVEWKKRYLIDEEWEVVCIFLLW